MPRPLPTDPEKRRLALWKRMLGQYLHWGSLVESNQLYYIQLEAEEVYYYDVLVGLVTLPPRQRQAFELHVLQGFTEQAAAQVMFPKPKWKTLVQQYSNVALARIVMAYDDFQVGIKPIPYVDKKTGKEASPHPHYIATPESLESIEEEGFSWSPLSEEELALRKKYYENNPVIAEALRRNNETLCRTSSGFNLSLEEAAEAILARGRQGVTKLSQKRDYLSAGQMERRQQREVYPTSGTPDPHLYSGMFRRPYNPVMADRKRGATPDQD